MQPLINRAVVEAIGIRSHLAELVAQYVTTAKKVHTVRMTEYIISRIPLVNDLFADLAEGHSEQMAITLGELPRQCLPGMVRIENCPERMLVTCAHIFLQVEALEYRNRNRLGEDYPENCELFDFLDHVEGFEIVERSRDALRSQSCHHYVFGGTGWFRRIVACKEPIQDYLFAHPCATIGYLLSRGYSFAEANDRAPGQIVVYHTSTQVRHFGIVESVGPERGAITVRSKFGVNHIFRHKAGLAYLYYGSGMTFLNRPYCSDASFVGI